LFKEIFCLEKIHGTSAHITYDKFTPIFLSFFAGGCKQENFEALFPDKEGLLKKFEHIGAPYITVYGEAYGGKLQGMRETYGPALKFACFEVRIGETWLNVPMAEEVVKSLGLEFVHWKLIPSSMIDIDNELYAPSVQAQRNGCGNDKIREGIVLRPPIEVRKNNGGRMIAKYKHPKFSETKTKRPIDIEKLTILTQAQAIADEWVTHNRLENILSSFPSDKQDITNLGNIIKLMLHDIFEKEGLGEVVDTREARKAVGAKTAEMFKYLYCQVPREPKKQIYFEDFLEEGEK